MRRFFRSLLKITCLGGLMMGIDARSETLDTGLRQRMEKAEADKKRLQSERKESTDLIQQAEVLLAKALRDGDTASAATIQEAITKAQEAITSCDAGLAACTTRIEALTGALKAVEGMGETTGMVIGSSVVDLRDVKDFTIDPSQLKGIASGVQGRLHGEKAAAIHNEVKSRAQRQKTGSNLATMSYAELMAGLDDEAKQGLKQGVAQRQKEKDQKLRQAFQLPPEIDEDLLDLILPAEPAKPSPLQQIKNEALRLLHSFDRVEKSEKERVFEAYQVWKTETEKLVAKVNEGKLTAKQYQDDYQLLDQRFLFSLTMIGRIAGEKEDEEIENVLPMSRKGGVK